MLLGQEIRLSSLCLLTKCVLAWCDDRCLLRGQEVKRKWGS